MTILTLILHNFVSFVLIVSAIVFIHEFGHFYVARLCGVKIDEFSIGFGRKIFGFRDKKGTLWKIAMIPLGGYVKMHGDRNAASAPDLKKLENMSNAERKKSFVFKNVYQRIAIVAAGPIANFILAIFVFTILFKVNGLNKVSPVVGDIMKDSAAFVSKVQKGDRILEIDGKKIIEFEDARYAISSNRGEEMHFVIQRGDKIIELNITPKIETTKDVFGEEIKVPMLGIAASGVEHSDLNIGQSFIQANKETYKISMAVFKALGELLTGRKSVKELGGPIKIAKYSGKTVDMGALTVMWFIAMISINLGVMNLLPVPVLDGGHLLYYFIEAIRGKALSEKTQQVGFKVGLSLVMTLMIFTTLNDVLQLLR